jgi:hypothetical protein
MNRNSKQKKAAFLKENKGKLAPPVFKKKDRPFPTPNSNEKEDLRVSLTHQRHIFNGVPCDCAVS